MYIQNKTVMELLKYSNHGVCEDRKRSESGKRKIAEKNVFAAAFIFSFRIRAFNVIGMYYVSIEIFNICFLHMIAS